MPDLKMRTLKTSELVPAAQMGKGKQAASPEAWKEGSRKKGAGRPATLGGLGATWSQTGSGTGKFPGKPRAAAPRAVGAALNRPRQHGLRHFDFHSQCSQ